MNKTLFGDTCVCIVRVSTSVQDYQAQINSLHKKADEFGLKVIKDIATKESGYRTFDKKDGYKELVSFMSENNCKICLCTELSRLARKKFILEAIKQWFVDNKIQLWTEDPNFFLFDDSGEVNMSTDIVFSVFAAATENEMKSKKVRLKRGRLEMNARGLSLTGKVTFGYTRQKNAIKEAGKYRSVMVVNETEAEQIRIIYDWYLNGIDGDITRCSLSQIHSECRAKGFGHYLQSRRNINKCLKNGLYTGHVFTKNKRKNPEYWTYGNKDAPKYIETSSEMSIDPIISQELFDAVQAKMLSVNTRKVKSTQASTTHGYADKSHKHHTLLAKLIRCPACGKFYLGDYRVRKDGFLSYNYRCQNHVKHGAYFLSMRFLDFGVWAFCRLHYSSLIEYIKKFPSKLDTKSIDERIQNIQERKAELQKELDEVVKRYLRIQSFVSSEAATAEFEKQSSRLKKEITLCDHQICKEEKAKNELQRADLIAEENSKTIAYVENNKAEMKKYINQMVKAVIPVYHSLDYIVVQIILLKGEAKLYTSDPSDYTEGLTHASYLIIYKRDNHRPKFRYISCPCCFDSEAGTFNLPNSDKATLPMVFSDKDEVHFKSIEYKPLNIYEDDKVKTPDEIK